jgi:hypothetical protein
MPIVRLPQGELRDEIRQPLYDSVDLTDAAALPGTRQFFANVQGKSLAQTNLEQNGALQNFVSFRIQGMALDAHNIIAATQGLLPIFLDKTSLTLVIGEKQYWRSNARYTAGRMMQDADASAAATLLQQFGWAAVAPVVMGPKHTIDINPLQAFRVDMVTDALTAAEVTACGTIPAGRSIRLAYSLKGLLRRPVQ